MQKIYNLEILPIISKLLLLLFLAKLLSLLLWWFLPDKGVSINSRASYRMPYHQVNLKNMLSIDTTVKVVNEVSKPSYSINSLLLKGIYGNEFYGFIVIAKKSAPSITTIVAVNEEYEGYKLIRLESNKAIFTRASKEYSLLLDGESEINSLSKNTLQTNEEYNSDEYSIKKQDIDSYSKDPSKLWKEISINGYKENGKLKGFRVDYIQQNSPLSKIGLKKGDIIIRANNTDLHSYKSVIDLYKNINKINSVSLVVMRNNQEKELMYEIH